MLSSAPSVGHCPSVVPVSREFLCQSAHGSLQMVSLPEPEDTLLSFMRTDLSSPCSQLQSDW